MFSLSISVLYLNSVPTEVFYVTVMYAGGLYNIFTEINNKRQFITFLVCSILVKLDLPILTSSLHPNFYQFDSI